MSFIPLRRGNDEVKRRIFWWNTTYSRTKNKRLHTAVLEWIAVFFCSTLIYFFAFRFPLFNNLSNSEVFVTRRAPFLFVEKWQISQYHICFGYGQAIFSKRATGFPEFYRLYGSDKQPIILAVLLFEWQTFIGRYP